MGGSEHGSVAGQGYYGAVQHLPRQLTELALLTDLPPDAVAVAQDAFDDEQAGTGFAIGCHRRRLSDECHSAPPHVDALSPFIEKVQSFHAHSNGQRVTMR